MEVLLHLGKMLASTKFAGVQMKHMLQARETGEDRA
jgi:hypothetical protein